MRERSRLPTFHRSAQLDYQIDRSHHSRTAARADYVLTNAPESHKFATCSRETETQFAPMIS